MHAQALAAALAIAAPAIAAPHQSAQTSPSAPTVSIQAFGYGGHGELGIGYRTYKQASPATVLLPSVPQSFAGGGSSATALLANGDLYGWGGNTFGQAGTGHKWIPQPTPVEIASGIVYATSGNENGCAIDTAGQALIWGSDSFGQAGQGVPGGGTEVGGIANAVATPTLVKGLPAGTVRQVECSASAYALLADGDLYGWGEGRFGQLGPPLQDEVLTPRLVAREVVEVAFGGIGKYEGTLLMRHADGSVWALGTNQNGQAGIGRASEPLPLPSRVRLSGPAVEIDESHSNGIARLADGTVETWGRGDGLGYAAPETCVVPCSGAPHPVVRGATGVSVGSGTGYAVVGGRLVDWGKDELGQLDAPATTAILPPAARLAGVSRVSAMTQGALAEVDAAPTPPKLTAAVGPGLAVHVAWSGGSGPFVVGLRECTSGAKERSVRSRTLARVMGNSYVVPVPRPGEWEVRIGSISWGSATVRVTVP